VSLQYIPFRFYGKLNFVIFYVSILDDCIECYRLLLILLVIILPNEFTCSNLPLSLITPNFVGQYKSPEMDITYSLHSSLYSSGFDIYSNGPVPKDNVSLERDNCGHAGELFPDTIHFLSYKERYLSVSRV
jgi:hypothetical protein